MNTISKYVYNTYLFLKSWFDSPKRMGTLFPTFARTGRMLASVIKDVQNVRVLELGMGTGQVTEQILNSGVRMENFATVEFDPKFCSEVQARHPDLKILNMDAASIATKAPKEFIGQTDYIISTLPLITLGVNKAKEIIDAIFKVLKPGGVYVQITYHPAKPTYMKSMGLKVTKLCISWINLPPTHIWRICKRQDPEPSFIPALT